MTEINKHYFFRTHLSPFSFNELLLGVISLMKHHDSNRRPRLKNQDTLIFFRSRLDDYFLSVMCGSKSFLICISWTSFSTKTLNWGSGSWNNITESATCKHLKSKIREKRPTQHFTAAVKGKPFKSKLLCAKGEKL